MFWAAVVHLQKIGKKRMQDNPITLTTVDTIFDHTCPFPRIKVDIDQSLREQHNNNEERRFNISACDQNNTLLESVIVKRLPSTLILFESQQVYPQDATIRDFSISVDIHVVSDNQDEEIARNILDLLRSRAICVCTSIPVERTEVFGYMKGQQYWSCPNDNCTYFKWKNKQQIVQLRQEMNVVDMFAELPLDCIYEILYYLDVNSLVREVRHMNKRWYNLLTSQSDHFWKSLIATRFTANGVTYSFGKYVSWMEKCYLLKRRQNPGKCICCLRATFSFGYFTACSSCTKYFQTKQQLVTEYGVTPKTVAQCSISITNRGRRFRWLTEVYRVVGNGNAVAGKRIMEQNAQSRSGKRMFLDSVKQRKKWTNLLVGTLQSEDFSQEKIDEVLSLHESDYHKLTENDFYQRYNQLKVLLDNEFQLLEGDEQTKLVTQSFRELDLFDCHSKFLATVFQNEKSIIAEANEAIFNLTKKELAKVNHRLWYNKYILGISVLRAGLKNHIELINRDRDVKQRLDDEVQILTDGQYTLHDALPPLVNELVENFINTSFDSTAAPKLVEVWKREEEFSALLEKHLSLDYSQIFLPVRCREWILNGTVDSKYAAIGEKGKPALKDVYDALNEFILVPQLLSETFGGLAAYSKLVHRHYSKATLGEITTRAVKNDQACIPRGSINPMIETQRYPIMKTILGSYLGKRKMVSTTSNSDTTSKRRKRGD